MNDDRFKALVGKRMLEIVQLLRKRGQYPIVAGYFLYPAGIVLMSTPTKDKQMEVCVDWIDGCRTKDGLPVKTHYRMDTRRSGKVISENLRIESAVEAAFAIERTFEMTN